MFSTNNCSSCKKIKPVFNRLSNRFTNVTFINANYTTPGGKALADQFGIRLFPTFMFFRNGQKLSINHKRQNTDRIVGDTQKDLTGQLQKL